MPGIGSMIPGMRARSKPSRSAWARGRGKSVHSDVFSIPARSWDQIFSRASIPPCTAGSDGYGSSLPSGMAGTWHRR